MVHKAKSNGLFATLNHCSIAGREAKAIVMANDNGQLQMATDDPLIFTRTRTHKSIHTILMDLDEMQTHHSKWNKVMANSKRSNINSMHWISLEFLIFLLECNFSQWSHSRWVMIMATLSPHKMIFCKWIHAFTWQFHKSKFNNS